MRHREAFKRMVVSWAKAVRVESVEASGRKLGGGRGVSLEASREAVRSIVSNPRG